MSEKYSNIQPLELIKKLGTHTYEIVDISTEWCGPCKLLKKALEKILQSEKFQPPDLHIYMIDGECFSIISNLLKLLQQVSNRQPEALKASEFLDLFIKEFTSKGTISKNAIEEQIMIMKRILAIENIEQTIQLPDCIAKLQEFQTFIEKFEISAYPTLLFFKNGKPIDTPLDKNDYESRGFEEYSEQKHAHIKNAVILDVPLKRGAPPTKLIQTNPVLEARIVGYSNPQNLKKILLKFISL